MTGEFSQDSDMIDGQVPEGTDDGQTIQDTPDIIDEQSSAGDDQSATETTDTDSQAAETFFDPKDIEGQPELEAAYKQMQGAFTKRMQGISGFQEKVEAYDAFMRDPVGSMTEIAKQQGYQLTKPGEQAGQQEDTPWEPKSWDDVTIKTVNSAVEAVMQKLQPYLGEINGIRKTSIEKQLAEIDPTWQQYENEMKAELADHPTLARDPAKLYRLSVPPKVLESRAMQQALKKFEDKAKSSQVSGSSTTTKKQAEGMPDGKMSFQESIAFAKKKLASEGIHPPGT